MGFALHLYRGRRGGPAYAKQMLEQRQYLDYRDPHLYLEEKEDLLGASVVADSLEHDT